MLEDTQDGMRDVSRTQNNERKKADAVESDFEGIERGWQSQTEPFLDFIS